MILAACTGINPSSSSNDSSHPFAYEWRRDSVTSLKVHNGRLFASRLCIVVVNTSGRFYQGAQRGDGGRKVEGGEPTRSSLHKRVIFPWRYYTYRNGRASRLGNYPVNAVRPRRRPTRDPRPPTKGYKNSINSAVLINSVFIWCDKQKLPPARQFRLISAIARRPRSRAGRTRFPCCLFVLRLLSFSSLRTPFSPFPSFSLDTVVRALSVILPPSRPTDRPFSLFPTDREVQLDRAIPARFRRTGFSKNHVAANATAKTRMRRARGNMQIPCKCN